MSDDEQKYLYGKCENWVKQNFTAGMEIIAIMESDKHEEGIVHCYLRDPNNGLCYDIRGEMKDDREVLFYTGVDYSMDNIDEFIFECLADFEMYLKWVDFEMVKEQFLA